MSFKLETEIEASDMMRGYFVEVILQNVTEERERKRKRERERNQKNSERAKSSGLIATTVLL